MDTNTEGRDMNDSERLAAALYLVIFEAHPMFGSTAKWGGGIGGAAMTSHCSLTQGAPPGDEWAEVGLTETPLRDYLRARESAGDPFDVKAAADALKVELLAGWKS